MSFEDDKRFAENGESKCLWLLHNSDKTRNVMDVRHDAYFQELDIDFLQLDINHKVNKIEVKTDRKGHQTGNFVNDVEFPIAPEVQNFIKEWKSKYKFA